MTEAIRIRKCSTLILQIFLLNRIDLQNPRGHERIPASQRNLRQCESVPRSHDCSPYTARNCNIAIHIGQNVTNESVTCELCDSPKRSSERPCRPVSSPTRASSNISRFGPFFCRYSVGVGFHWRVLNMFHIQALKLTQRVGDPIDLLRCRAEMVIFEAPAFESGNASLSKPYAVCAPGSDWRRHLGLET